MAGSVRLNVFAIREILNSPAGEVAADLVERCIRIDRAAKRLCPVDTGRLRSSISWAVQIGGEGIVGRVGTDVEYAPYVEFGTSRMRAQPYLRPAIQAGAG
jgi:HK97 gp10 family phage protein